MEPERAATVIAACAVLHNISKDRNQPEIEEEDEEEEVDATPFEGEETGNAV